MIPFDSQHFYDCKKILWQLAVLISECSCDVFVGFNKLIRLEAKQVGGRVSHIKETKFVGNNSMNIISGEEARKPIRQVKSRHFHSYEVFL
jgi:hypothetical protein